jgi:hypothetical protein
MAAFAGPMVRIRFPPAKSLQTISSSTAEPVWPHDNAIIAIGFKFYGFRSQAARSGGVLLLRRDDATLTRCAEDEPFSRL